MQRYLLLLLASSVFAQQPAETFRSWTSSDGKKVEAAMLGTEGDGVRLKLKTGAVITVPLSRLSGEDQLLVKNTGAPAVNKLATAPVASTEWPRSITLDEPPEPKVIKEDKDKREFIYRSEHYEFRCDSKLGSNVVKEFSRIFEATWMLNCKLPLDWKPTPEEGQEFYVATIYTSKEDYFENGAIPGSAGYYSTGKKSLFVPLSSLGVKMVGTRVSLEKTSDDDNQTLIHEISHQMMNHWLPKLRTWFTEGSAEVTEIYDYTRGRFSGVGLKQRMKDYAARRSGGKTFTMLDPDELFGLDGRTWAGALSGTSGQASQNYASAGLMTYYFYFLDDKGDGANVINYVRALETSLGRRGEPEAFATHLIRGRSNEQMRDDIKKAFRKEGVIIEFSAPGRNSPTTSTN